MKQLLTCAVVAAVVSVAILWVGEALEDGGQDPEASELGATSTGTIAYPVSYTDSLIEDTWVNAARGAGSDRRTLTDASSSICFLTKIEISGIQGPEDSNACGIEIDDFTGFWQVIATVDEGGRSEVRCNARCLSWNSSGEEP